MATTHALTAVNILRNIAGGNAQLADRMAYVLSDYGYDHIDTAALGIDRLGHHDIRAMVLEALQAATFDNRPDNVAAQNVAQIIARIYGTFDIRVRRQYIGESGLTTADYIVSLARDEYGDTEPEFMRELECAIRRTFIGIYSVGI